MILLDTSALFAYFCPSDPHHSRMAEFMSEASDPFIVSPYVVGELDYLVSRRMGQQAELLVLDELSSGSYEMPVVGPVDLLACMHVIGRYFDLRIGVTDASLVVLADRYDTLNIATFDYRHFSALRSIRGEPFTLLP